MFRKLLIANRGEIAVRVMQACRELGIRTVAVYSDADRGALHVRYADEALPIGPPSAAQSYLNQSALLEAARISGVEAIHPGYGFLSENADFAEACRDAGFIFVGPPTEAIRAMGDKSGARAIARSAGVPVIEGYDGEEQSDTRFASEARRIGYPVLIKAAMGGGGKAMHPVQRAGELRPALATARREARASFGDDKLLLERLLGRPRHVEVQVLGDQHGRLIALGERDCSVQRRHQKVVEEAPSPAVDGDLRRRLCDLAVRLAAAVGYTNAGTVELLLDEDGSAYFLEMNTRLQVEHAITEAVYGVDLVRLQIELAAGARLPFSRAPDLRGHAIECRIYAEDPSTGFLPSTGRILSLRLPEGSGIRNDPGVATGDTVGLFYDPLLAKLTVSASNREAAIERMRVALTGYDVLGLRTNVRFLRAIVESDVFRRGEADIAFLERELPSLLRDEPPPPAVFSAATAAELANGALSAADDDPWLRLGPWRMGAQDLRIRWQCGDLKREVRADRQTGEPALWRLGCEGEEYLLGPASAHGSVLLRAASGMRRFDIAWDGPDVWVGGSGAAWRLSPVAASPVRSRGGGQSSAASSSSLSVSAPMPGVVVRVSVREGDTVVAHQPLLVLEAMKMEHGIEAPSGGRVARIYCREGELVSAGARLIDLEA